MVDKLISSPSDHPRAYICNRCIADCNAIMKDAPVDPPVPKAYLEKEAIPPGRFRLATAPWRVKILLLGPASAPAKRLARILAWVLQVPFAIVDPAPRS